MKGRAQTQQRGNCSAYSVAFCLPEMHRVNAGAARPVISIFMSAKRWFWYKDYTGITAIYTSPFR